MAEDSKQEDKLRKPLILIGGVLVASGTAFQLAGVTTVLLANIVLIFGIWIFLIAEAWYSDWIKRTGLYRNSIIALIGCAGGIGTVTLSDIIKSMRPTQADVQASAEDDVFTHLSAVPEYGDDLKDTIITFTNNSKFAIGKHQVDCLVYSIAFVGGGGIGYNPRGSPGSFVYIRPSGERIGPGGDAQTDTCLPPKNFVTPPVECADIGAEITYSLEAYPDVVRTKQLRFVSHKLGKKIVWTQQPINYQDNDCIVTLGKK
jgi:hypothetical protein